jgi:cytochrome c oxidase subunit 2
MNINENAFFHNQENNPYKIPSVPFQISFQEPATPVMNGLLDLHDYVFFFIIIIITVVLILLVQVVFLFSLSSRKFFFSKYDLFSYSDQDLEMDNHPIIKFSIFKLKDLSFLEKSLKIIPKNNLNISNFFLNLKKNFNKIRLVTKNSNLIYKNHFNSSVFLLNFDYLKLINSTIKYSNFENLKNKKFDNSKFFISDFSTFSIDESDNFSFDYSDYSIFPNYYSNLDFFFFFNTNNSFINSDNFKKDINFSNSFKSLENSSSKNDIFETNFSEIILNNIVFTIFSSKVFQTFVNDIKKIPKFDDIINHKREILSDLNIDEIDVLIFENLNELFLENFLSSKIISLQRNLKIGYFNHSTKLEIIWTIIPICIIGLIITPSFFFMYAIDEDMESLLTIRVIGHQWFWSYIYALPDYSVFLTSTDDSNLNSQIYKEYLSFDSYMLDNLSDGSPRLLATDSILILPKYSHINCIITSSDVIHSWAVPSFGVKVDAVPGRLNRADVFVEHEGMFFGQCSELCGVNHSFMPIHIQVVSLSDFLRFLLV